MLARHGVTTRFALGPGVVGRAADERGPPPEGGVARRADRLSDLVTTFGEGDETWQTTLEALREFAQGENDLELDALIEVSPLVSRFSVHHLVSPAPGESGLG